MKKFKIEFEWPFVRTKNFKAMLKSHQVNMDALHNDYKNKHSEAVKLMAKEWKEELEKEKKVTSDILKVVQKIEPIRMGDGDMILNLVVNDRYMRECMQMAGYDKRFWEDIAERMSWEFKRELTALSVGGFARAASRREIDRRQMECSPYIPFEPEKKKTKKK